MSTTKDQMMEMPFPQLMVLKRTLAEVLEMRSVSAQQEFAAKIAAVHAEFDGAFTRGGARKPTGKRRGRPRKVKPGNIPDTAEPLTNGAHG